MTSKAFDVEWTSRVIVIKIFFHRYVMFLKMIGLPSGQSSTKTLSVVSGDCGVIIIIIIRPIWL